MRFKFSTTCEEMVAQLLANEIARQITNGSLVDLTDIELVVQQTNFDD